MTISGGPIPPTHRGVREADQREFFAELWSETSDVSELYEQLSAAAAAQPDAFLLPFWASLLEGSRTFEDFLNEVRGRRELTYLTIDTTGACDLTCAGMCYYNPAISLYHKIVDEQLLKDAIRQASEELSMRVLAFAGKEPFLNPERLFSLLRFAGALPERPFVIGLVTNGRHVARHSERIRQVVKESCLDYIDVSIDTSNAHEHDAFRGIDGTHRLASDAVRWINRELTGTRVTVVSVLRRENQDGILELPKVFGHDNLNYQIQPIQPPPYSPFPPLTATFMIGFLDRLVNSLAGPMHGAGISVSIELLGIYLLEAVQAGIFSWSDLREDHNHTLFVERTVGGNTLIITCDLFPLQAWRLSRITYNGAYLAHMHFLQSPDPDQFAVGFLGHEPLATLFDRAMGPDSHFARIVRSRRGHDCTNRPCWGNCFGGWNGAENGFLEKGRKLSEQPRLCTKTVDDFNILESKPDHGLPPSTRR